MSFLSSTPPRPDAGQMSLLSEVLRPLITLDKKACQRARRLCRKELSVTDIATKLDATEDNIRLALATTRTKNTRASRCTLNVTTVAGQFVMGEGEAREPVWHIFDRLLEELLEFRSGVTPTS